MWAGLFRLTDNKKMLLRVVFVLALTVLTTISAIPTTIISSTSTTSTTTAPPSTSTSSVHPLAQPPVEQQPPPTAPQQPPPAQQPSPGQQPDPGQSQHNFPNTYRFVQNDGRSMVSESRDGDGNVAGSYSFLGPDGIQRTTYYRAGPLGYEMIGGPQISGLTMMAPSGRSARPSPGEAPAPSAGSPVQQVGKSAAAGTDQATVTGVGNVLQEVASLQQLIDSPQFLLNRPTNEMYTNPEEFYQQKFEQVQDSLYKTNVFNIPIPKPFIPAKESVPDV